jgi:hypothetical protein
MRSEAASSEIIGGRVTKYSVLTVAADPKRTIDFRIST